MSTQTWHGPLFGKAKNADAREEPLYYDEDELKDRAKARDSRLFFLKGIGITAATILCLGLLVLGYPVYRYFAG